jgi:hypothetical protein
MASEATRQATLSAAEAVAMSNLAASFARPPRTPGAARKPEAR